MPLTKATYAMISGAPVLVDDFIPAGVDPASTNVAPYIQNAINSLPTSNTGIKGHLAFSARRYFIGSPSGATPALLIDRAMTLSGNGATLVAAGSTTGRVLQVTESFVTINDLSIAKESFPLDSTANLTGEALGMYAVSGPCQKWSLSNIDIIGFQYGMVFLGDGSGCSYGDVFVPRIRFTAYAMVFEATDLPLSYCTDIKVFGGELSLDGFGAFTNSTGIDIRNSTSYTVTNGISFFGTDIEGYWERKVKCAGQDCAFNNLYWDNTNGGTDIEFVNSGSGQVAKNNIIIGGSPLNIQVIANTSGEANTVIDPAKGIAFGNPILGASTAAQFTQKSAGGGGVIARFANSAAPATNNSVQLSLEAKKADGTLVVMGGIDATTVSSTGQGQGKVTLVARNSGGYSYPVVAGEGETGNLYPGVDNVGTLGKSNYRWSNIFSGITTLIDGVTAPSTIAGHAQIYVDTADGDLKVKFGDGTVKTLATDT